MVWVPLQKAIRSQFVLIVMLPLHLGLTHSHDHHYSHHHQQRRRPCQDEEENRVCGLPVFVFENER